MNILELEILTDDLTETEKFYSEILELPIRSKSKNSISFLAGQSILTFIKSEKQNPTYHFAFNIPQNKFEEAMNWATVKFDLIKNSEFSTVTTFENWNAKAFYFYDNNRNILEFIARFDLENNSKDTFTSSSIQSISEVGIVTDEPLNYGENLVADNDITFFHKGPKRDDFVALGNDGGLFVIAKTNRNWYPTNDPAQKHWTRIKITTNNSTKELSVNEKNASR